MLPFLTWPGGKRWFVLHHAHLLPSNYGTYIEPFLGSGAVFFHLQPRKALLGDKNEALIATYQAIRNDPTGVRRHLRKHNHNHSEDYYYFVRGKPMRTRVTRAARFVYLNRTCYNGIYRVNVNGMFNVPIGGKTSVLLDTDDFTATARALRRATLRPGDFEHLIERATAGDLVFADPPYTVRHNNNGFVRYNEKMFSWADQERSTAGYPVSPDRERCCLT
jgi:DNA adenine methylase